MQKQKIGLHTAISIVVGSIIGSGIFMKPATMAAQTGSAPLLIFVWIAGGILSLFGALIFAEVGAMFPETGGLYVYLKKMYGKFPAFLYGWSAFSVINTAAVAAIAFVCAKYSNFFLHLPGVNEATVQSFVLHLPYVGDLYPLDDLGVKALAIFFVISLSWLNVISLSASGKLQLISTLIKVGVLVMLVVGILFSGNGEVSNLWMKSPDAPAGLEMMRAAVAALTGAFVAYDGWQNIGFMGGEIEQPKKNLPKSIILGVVSCMGVYVLVNIAYAYALPVDVMARSPLVASDAMAAMLGNTSGAVIAAMIVIVTFGAINGNVMSVARVTLAMGKDGLFFAPTACEHPASGTPANALWYHCVWACILIMTGSFDMLADMFIFITWVFIIIACIGLVRLRKKMPNHPRPFRMWLYPWSLLIFTAFALFYVGSTLHYEISAFIAGKIKVVNSLLGLIITLAGVPLYFYFTSRQKKRKVE
jgi:basic amino acid/polyamine antiporter, APA family